ncbi:MAG: MerR family transcriptional regulator [Pseudomonadota bacterium]
MAKSKDAFRTISEVAEWLDTQPHVLRFWESKFSQIKPVKRAGGRRYYRPNDMRLIGGIKKLLHEDGLTIKGAQKVLREKGPRYVFALAPPLDGEDPVMLDVEDAVVVPIETKSVRAKEHQSIEVKPSKIILLKRKANAIHEVDRTALAPLLSDLRALRDKLKPTGPNW